MNTEQLKRHIQKSDLTALEKRYLKGLVEAQTPREGMRLIDADELERMCENPEYTLYNGDMLAEWMKYCIVTAPTIEAEPVRHGRWIGWHGDKMVREDEYRHYRYYSCSQCHIRTVIKSSYCSNCGAKMDGGAENDKS